MSDVGATIAGSGGEKRQKKVRQAVVIVHGMGEQRPLDALTQFVKAALPPRPAPPQDEPPKPPFYSRPDLMTESYESRVFLAPPVEATDGSIERTQTEFYEYHWAHLMQGNRLDDMWPTFKRMMLQPWRVPAGLKVVWVLFWGLLVGAGVVLWRADWGYAQTDDVVRTIIETVVGVGLGGFVLTYVITRLLPRFLTTSFVDVVRYLDTSPRSYGVRRDIRKGMVDLLVNLHGKRDMDGESRYQRIVVVAHSLGAFIAYDGITFLWTRMNTDKTNRTSAAPAGLREVEEEASALVNAEAPEAGRFQQAQRDLWLGLRAQGNPWLITDFVTLGTPMYFADRLYTKNRADFDGRVKRWELPTCPPQAEGGKSYNNLFKQPLWFSFVYANNRSLYHGAPFAVIRWTNMWFPARWGFFGDWFGERLAPLFGKGIRDVPLMENTKMKWFLRSRFTPGYAHALYLKFPEDDTPGSVTRMLRDAIDFGSTEWLQPTVHAPPVDSTTA